jgi:hypothetical protein
MEEIHKLKQEGNEFYQKGTKSKDRSMFAQACHCYGRSIEAILLSEDELNSDPRCLGELELLKPTLFLNLGMANFQLEDFRTSFICCNTAMLLCNDCTLCLKLIGVEQDVNETIDIVKPVVGMLCYAVLCYVMLCCAMLCCAMLCCAMLCCAMLCYAMLCYAMLCYAMLCYAMLCYAMLCYAMLCYAMLCYAMLCYAMLCCAVLCCATVKLLLKVCFM